MTTRFRRNNSLPLVHVFHKYLLSTNTVQAPCSALRTLNHDPPATTTTTQGGHIVASQTGCHKQSNKLINNYKLCAIKEAIKEPVINISKRDPLSTDGQEKPSL